MRSLPVVLHGVGGAGGGRVGVLVELTAGPALAQQVPALVQLLLDVLQPGLVDLATAAHLMLLLDEALDPVEDVDVLFAHVASMLAVVPPHKDRP
jgi:hypothetical protein